MESVTALQASELCDTGTEASRSILLRTHLDSQDSSSALQVSSTVVVKVEMTGESKGNVGISSNEEAFCAIRPCRLGSSHVGRQIQAPNAA